MSTIFVISQSLHPTYSISAVPDRARTWNNPLPVHVVVVVPFPFVTPTLQVSCYPQSHMTFARYLVIAMGQSVTTEVPECSTPLLQLLVQI